MGLVLWVTATDVHATEAAITVDAYAGVAWGSIHLPPAGGSIKATIRATRRSTITGGRIVISVGPAWHADWQGSPGAPSHRRP